MLVDMYRVSCLDPSVGEDIARALGRLQQGFKGTDGCLRQRLLRDLEHHESFTVVSCWRDEESLEGASPLHAAIDEALDLLRVKTTASAYDIIQDLAVRGSLDSLITSFRGTSK
jgi:quinol monooxygenase YgiN